MSKAIIKVRIVRTFIFIIQGSIPDHRYFKEANMIKAKSNGLGVVTQET